MKKVKNLSYILLIIFIISTIGGCGGSGGTLSIGDSTPGQVITEATPTTLHMENGTDYFNSGNYSNAVFEFQQALLAAQSSKEIDSAYEALGWAMSKNGSPAAQEATTGEVSVISTFESIGDSKLYDATNQDINDARVGLAFAYVSRNKSGDIDKARSLLEKIDPNLSNPSSPQFNQYFSYIPKLNTGMTNGMVHALIAYTYFLNGNIESAKTQIEYAYKREPANDFIRKIRTNLTLLGLFN